MNNYQRILPANQNGIVLLEALIAVLIFSLGVLALAGLQSAMIKNTDDARYRAEATFVAQEKLGEIWTNTANKTSLTEYATASPEAVAKLPNGTREVTVSADQVVTVEVGWALPGQATHKYQAVARIEGIYN